MSIKIIIKKLVVLMWPGFIPQVAALGAFLDYFYKQIINLFLDLSLMVRPYFFFLEVRYRALPF